MSDLNDHAHRLTVATALRTTLAASWQRVVEAVEIRGAYAVTGTLAQLLRHHELEREIARLEAPPEKENDSE